jgi:hypothetical protein
MSGLSRFRDWLNGPLPKLPVLRPAGPAPETPNPIPVVNQWVSCGYCYKTLYERDDPNWFEKSKTHTETSHPTCETCNMPSSTMQGHDIDYCEKRRLSKLLQQNEETLQKLIKILENK